MQIGNDEEGSFLAYATGGKPDLDYAMQATIRDRDQEIKKRTYTVTLYKYGWQEDGNAYKQYVYIRDVTKNSIVYIEPDEILLGGLDNSWTTLVAKNDKDGVCIYATAYEPDMDYTVKLVIAETKYVSNT